MPQNQAALTEIPIGPSASGVSLLVLTSFSAPNTAIVKLKVPARDSTNGFTIHYLQKITAQTPQLVDTALQEVQKFLSEGHNPGCQFPDGEAAQNLRQALTAAVNSVVQNTSRNVPIDTRKSIIDANKLAYLALPDAKRAELYNQRSAQLSFALNHVTSEQEWQLEELLRKSTFAIGATPKERIRSATDKVIGKIVEDWPWKPQQIPLPDPAFMEAKTLLNQNQRVLPQGRADTRSYVKREIIPPRRLNVESERPPELTREENPLAYQRGIEIENSLGTASDQQLASLKRLARSSRFFRNAPAGTVPEEYAIQRGIDAAARRWDEKQGVPTTDTAAQAVGRALAHNKARGFPETIRDRGEDVKIYRY